MYKHIKSKGVIIMKNVLNCCLYFTASKLNRIITKMAEEEFRIIGLSPMYGFLLLVVNENPGVSPTDIAKELNIAPSTITRFIDKLESKGYVERKFEGKYSYIHLTEKGVNLQSDINKAWERLYHRYSKILGYDEGADITKRINEVADKLIEEY